MPKIAVDYSKTIIYKICCNDLAITEIYVGSTTDFTRRKATHKCHCKSVDLKIYNTINANGGWAAWSMIEIERFPCDDGNAARKRERYWYETLNANLNMILPAADADYSQQYYLKNRERLIAKQAVYDEINKQAINKRHIEYYHKNKEQIKIQQKLYRESKKSQPIANADSCKSDQISHSLENEQPI